MLGYQADRQGQSAHEQWLRQIRRDAYAAFISPARAVLQQYLNALGHRQRGEWDLMEEVLRPQEQLRELFLAHGALELEAPEGVAEKAAGLRGFLFQALCFARKWERVPPSAAARERADQRLESLEAELEALISLCKASLQD